MNTTPLLMESLPDLLAPPRATEPTEAGLAACLAHLPVRIVFSGVGPEAYRILLTPDVPAVAWNRWIGIARRALEDAGMDIKHVTDRSGRPCVAVYRPGTP